MIYTTMKKLDNSKNGIVEVAEHENLRHYTVQDGKLFSRRAGDNTVAFKQHDIDISDDALLGKKASKETHVLCPKCCLGTAFTISYGSYECWGTCTICHNAVLLYDG